jgi:hypothetical protein
MRQRRQQPGAVDAKPNEPAPEGAPATPTDPGGFPTTTGGGI